MQREDATREIRTQSPDAFLQKARKRGWICPECHNGEGKDGDGIVKNPKGGGYKCFKCGLYCRFYFRRFLVFRLQLSVPPPLL